MSNRRVEMDRLQELVRLHRLGTPARQVARVLRMGVDVERSYRRVLETAGLLRGDVQVLPELEVLKAAVVAARPAAPPAPQQTSSLEAHRAQVEAWVAKGLRPQAIFTRLQMEAGVPAGSLSAVKRLVGSVRRAQGVSEEDVAIPVETAPGEVAQVDFGEVGRLYDADTGTLRRAWVFVMVLGYSRHLFATVVFDQRVETWLRCHEAAFAYFGGVPRCVVPDNLKAAVVRAAFGVDGERALQRSYRALARHYGFIVDPAPPRAPEKKGKVEAGVRYVKGNFFAGRTGEDARECEAALQRWLRDVASVRVHGTTGRQPRLLFQQAEATALRALPTGAWAPEVWHEARVHRDAHVMYGRRLYSVPWRLIGQRVWLCVTAHDVRVYAQDERVATHPLRGESHRSTVESHLPEARAALRHRSRDHWETRAARLGPHTEAYVRAVFDADDVLSQLRCVQAIVVHLEGFPRERAEAACRRALHFGNLRYQGLKDILRRGLDLQPLPQDGHLAIATPAATAAPPAPRYARDVRTLLR
ncbi:IS21 family transposase [Myxococcus faecalis]|uniref:IS21 family transposase n=1 Tax=Myxococcus faecalis TaxID=3115646 RepID=UPI003CF04B3A